MVKTTEVVYKYVEGEFAVKHKKDGFKANSTRVLIGYHIIYRKYVGRSARFNDFDRAERLFAFLGKNLKKNR